MLTQASISTEIYSKRDYLPTDVSLILHAKKTSMAVLQGLKIRPSQQEDLSSAEVQNVLAFLLRLKAYPYYPIPGACRIDLNDPGMVANEKWKAEETQRQAELELAGIPWDGVTPEDVAVAVSDSVVLEKPQQFDIPGENLSLRLFPPRGGQGLWLLQVHPKKLPCTSFKILSGEKVIAEALQEGLKLDTEVLDYIISAEDPYRIVLSETNKA